MSGIVNPPPWPSELKPRPSHGRHRRPEWVSDPVECDHPITATVAGETHCLDCHTDFREDR